MKKIVLMALPLLFVCGMTWAAPSTYVIDPEHTHPSFEVDHMGGLSVWRGFFRKTKGTITIDKMASTGTVSVTMFTKTIDFGHYALNRHVVGPEILNAEKFPLAAYKGTLSDFKGGIPSAVLGELTLRGITKPVNLHIDSYMCIQEPALKREICGANAVGTFDRSDFGVNYGQQYGFRQEVMLRIQVEAIKNK